MSERYAGESRLGLQVSKGLIAKFIQAVLGFVGTIIFARVLGPTDFGGYYLLLSIVDMANRPIAGVSNATQKRYAESDTFRREILGVQTGFNVAYIALLSAIAALLHEALRSYTGLDDSAVLLVILLLSLGFFSSVQPFLAAIGQIGTQTWIDTLRSILTLGLQLLFVLAGLAAAGMVFGLALATFLMLPLTYRYLRNLPTWPSPETVQSVWSFARFSVPSTFVSKAYDRFDILLLGFLASPAVAGQYEVAYKLTVPAMFVAGLASSGMLAKVSDLVSRGQAVGQDLENALAFSSIFAIPIFFGALAMPRSIVVTAYGAAYRDAAWLLVGLALFRVLQTQVAILSGFTQAIDRPDVSLRVSIVALVVNVSLGIALFQEMGALGIVLATVVAEVLRYATFRRFVGGETATSGLPRALFHQIAAGLVMFGVVEISNEFIPVRSWVTLSVLIGAGAIVYFVVLTVLSTHFRVTIKSVLADAAEEFRGK